MNEVSEPMFREDYGELVVELIDKMDGLWEQAARIDETGDAKCHEQATGIRHVVMEVRDLLRNRGHLHPTMRGWRKINS